MSRFLLGFVSTRTTRAVTIIFGQRLLAVVLILFLLPFSATALQQIQTPYNSKAAAKVLPNKSMAQSPAAVSFSHIHLYVDELEDLAVYKDLEDKLNQFSSSSLSSSSNNRQATTTTTTTTTTLQEKQRKWQAIVGKDNQDDYALHTEYIPQNRDVVKQLLCSFGFRVTGARYACIDKNDNNNNNHTEKDEPVTTINTRSLLVTSRDPSGVQIVVTALEKENESTGAPTSTQADGDGDAMRHFDASKLKEFFACHRGFQGIAVLAFMVVDIERIKAQYEALHPELVADYQTYGSRNTKVLEVYAYYQSHEKGASQRTADKGTVLRFIQADDDTSTCALPGLTPVPATFEDNSSPAYCDHWVSNVFSRTEFLDTLHDTLGFTKKVNFDAGVVAAGEAQIESTVTGNESTLSTTDNRVALRDQSQVYLPINNALSSVGHVHGFLQELGQGVQHVASRVENLVEFVQRGNDYRKITNEGFTFLRIPRSYYGVLTVDMLMEGIRGDGTDILTEECAKELMEGLVRRGTLTKEGALDLDLSREQVDAEVEETLTGSRLEEYQARKEGILNVLMRSRFKNLYSLLRDHVSEETYLGIVRNQILVDIQGEDLLYQIFTSNILQRQAGEEAPFFEFIQRVCSECVDEKTGCPQKIRPGCGGFGIRNFLTLFLSIEVSKAMQEVTDALLEGDEEKQQYAQAMVDCFTEQLNEANPILTKISDAMTLEGQLKEELAQAMLDQDHDAIAMVKQRMSSAAERKLLGNKELMDCSMRYNNRMKALREEKENKQK